jgi:Ser/Thr protein kinase RdoA (MazF antagonist)
VPIVQNAETTGGFELLSPDLVLRAVEESHGLSLDGTLDSYSSYVNRVYGIRDEGGHRFVAKFYRPGRWSAEAIREEHRYLRDCEREEIPVIAPLPGKDGETLRGVTAGEGDQQQSFLFALFPRTGGRTFEPETEKDYFRLGSLLGRCHGVGAKGQAPNRVRCDPHATTAAYIQELLSRGLVHPKWRDDFAAVCRETLALVSPLFADVIAQRIHGDCHRGNIIDRPGEGLVLIDFDDMMMGPPVQDLWLILPGSLKDVGRELHVVLEGYSQFARFDPRTLGLVEPLRFMRMIYFLAWRARQRNDFWFRESFPDWGNEAFWITEIEDLRTQQAVIREALEASSAS